MNIIFLHYDLIFLCIIIFSAILALIRGAIAEILSLSVWFIAFIVMQHYGYLIDKKIPPNITSSLIRSGIVFIIIFIALAIIAAIIKHLCASVIRSIGLGGLNALLGGVFGVIRGILICGIIIVIIEMLNLDPNHLWHKTRLFPTLQPVVDWIINAIPTSIKELPKHTLLIP